MGVGSNERSSKCIESIYFPSCVLAFSINKSLSSILLLTHFVSLFLLRVRVAQS